MDVSKRHSKEVMFLLMLGIAWYEGQCWEQSVYVGVVTPSRKAVLKVKVLCVFCFFAKWNVMWPSCGSYRVFMAIRGSVWKFCDLCGVIMPPHRRCRRHYVFGLSVRPDGCPSGFFVYAITQVLLDGISSNLVQGYTPKSR